MNVQKLPSIQVLRGVAACSVAAMHAKLVWWPGGTDGLGLSAGVDLFFVISGFIMATVAKGKTPGTFLRDRLWRVYPLWILAVMPWLLQPGYSTEQLLVSVTLWPVYGGTFHFPLLFVGWTLAYELLFYGAVALAIRTHVGVPLAIYAALFLVACTTGSMVFYFLGNPIALEFLLGVGVALAPRHPRVGLWLGAIGVTCLFALPFRFGAPETVSSLYTASLRVLAWGVPAAAVVYGCLCYDHAFRHWRFPVFIGNASYSIYLFHPLVIVVTALSPLGHFALSVAVGCGVYLLFERRIMQLRIGYLSKGIRPGSTRGIPQQPTSAR